MMKQIAFTQRSGIESNQEYIEYMMNQNDIDQWCEEKVLCDVVFNQLVHLSPQNMTMYEHATKFYGDLFAIYGDIDNFEKAIAYGMRRLALQPDDTAYRLLGQVYYYARDYGGAIEFFEQVQLDRTEEVSYKIATSYRQLGYTEKAYEQYKALIGEEVCRTQDRYGSSYKTDAYNALCTIYLNQHRVEEALQCIEESISNKIDESYNQEKILMNIAHMYGKKEYLDRLYHKMMHTRETDDYINIKLAHYYAFIKQKYNKAICYSKKVLGDLKKQNKLTSIHMKEAIYIIVFSYHRLGVQNKGLRYLKKYEAVIIQEKGSIENWLKSGKHVRSKYRSLAELNYLCGENRVFLEYAEKCKTQRRCMDCHDRQQCHKELFLYAYEYELVGCKALGIKVYKELLEHLPHNIVAFTELQLRKKHIESEVLKKKMILMMVLGIMAVVTLWRTLYVTY